MTPAPHLTPAQRVAEKLRDRIGDYMTMRRDAVAAVGALRPSPDAVQLDAQRQSLQTEIRRRRVDAKQGDILQPDIRAYIRETLLPVVRGDQGRHIWARLQDDAPDPDSVRLDVNAAYPAGLPFPTTPAPLLDALPALPTGLAYRVIGRHLILLDQPADLMIDYMRNALPPPVATSSP
jgi:hypothetical protein